MNLLMRIITGIIVIFCFSTSVSAVMIHPKEQKNIQINGELVSPTCQSEVYARKIDLGEYLLHALQNACKSSSKCYVGKEIPFSIDLVNCPEWVKTIDVYLSSSQPVTNQDYLPVVGVEGIGLQIKDINHDTIKFDALKPKSYPVTLNHGSVSLPYTAQLKVLDLKKVKVGTFNGLMVIGISYQ